MDMLSPIRDIVRGGGIRSLDSAIDLALSAGCSADEILNRALLPGLAAVGQRYRDNDDLIPDLLCAARCVTAGLEKLQPELQKGAEQKRERIIIGTVAWDLHDIGKNLVAILLRCAGFDVLDLGVDVSPREFVRAVTEHPEARIVCLSCLLTPSLENMRSTVSELRSLPGSMELRIMVGGAPVTSEFARSIGADAYTADAVAAVEKARELLSAGEKGGMA